MLPKIIAFRKSIDQRKKEYSPLFNSQESCKSIFSLWAFDLELAIENVKWQALWQLSEESCCQFKTLFPTTVVVTVEEIQFEELSATVVVEAVQEDIAFPEMVNVPLFELFPTEVQRTASRSVIRNIADYLDRCRFFFLYLWYPWDSTDDSTLCEWANQHLDGRLKLQYDIRNGALDKTIAHHIRCLMTEALEVVDAIEYSEETDPNDEQKLISVKNLIRKENIKLELNLFEAPELRTPMTAYINEKNMVSKDPTIAVLMASGSSLRELTSLIEKIKAFINEESKIKLSNDPQHIFKTVQNGSTVIVSGGTHYLENLGNLTYGGEIKGVGAVPDETIVTPVNMTPRRFIFLTCFNSLLFENITIDRAEGVLISAAEGNIRIVSCRMVGRPGCLARGIIVQPGSRLEMVNCYLSDLGTAVIAKSNATVLLDSTSIHSCAEGIKIMDGGTATLSNVLVGSCSLAGIVLETSEEGENLSGGIDILQSKSSISITGSRFQNNKVDALIDHLPLESV